MRDYLSKAEGAAPALARGRTVTRVLPNGFTVLVEPDHSAPVTSVQVWVETGSIHEGEWLGSGISHLLEHMLFKGTEKRGPNEIAREAQEAGGFVNAYTSYDRTVYYIDAPASAAATAIELLADATLNSTIPEDEFAKEQEVIRREFAMGFDDPDRVGDELSLSTAFSKSPYRHPIIGHLELFDRLGIEDVRAYYRARYVPDNMFLVVTGDVDPGEIFALASKWFGPARRRAKAPLFIPREPAQLGRREVHEEFATELSRCSMVWHVPPVTHPDMAPLDVLAAILGCGYSTPLYLELRERQRLVHEISSYSYMAGEMGIFGISFLCDPDKRAEAAEAALDIVERYRSNPSGENEVAKARKNILAEHLGSLSTARGRAADIGVSWLLARNPDVGAEYLDQIGRVDTAEVRRVAEKYLTRASVTVTSLNPKGSLARAARPAPAPGARTIERFTLPNGLRVLACEDRKLPLVTAVAFFRGGLLTETEETNGITALAARTLVKGTASRTSEEIDELIESVGGSLHADSGNNSFSVGVEVMKPDVRLGLEILSDVLAHAEFPEDQVAREKEDQIADIKAAGEQITTVARRAMKRAAYGSHPYGLPASGTEDSVRALTREQLLAFRDQCVTARNGVLAIFGDIATGEARALAEELFGNLPPGELLFTSPQPIAPLDHSPEVTLHEPKQQAVLMVGFRGADALGEDRVALELIDAACSGMASRLFHRIREELGLAYFVGVSQTMGFGPGLFTFYLGTDPAKVGPVRAAFEEEIAGLAGEGLTADELARAKKNLIGSEAIRNQSLKTFARVVGMDELYGLCPDYHARRIAAIEAVTPEQVRAVARKYFFETQRATVLVTPEHPTPNG